MRRFRRVFARRLIDDEEGGSTVEFVLVFPMFIALVMTVFEAGWMMTKSMMLDRGLEIAMRDIRLGTFGSTVTADQIKQKICNNSLLFRDCMGVMMLELKPVPDSTAFPADDADCITRQTVDGVTTVVQPQDDFNPGSTSELMFVRACVVIEPMFPGIGLGLQLTNESSGGVRMVAISAFMNEPE